MSSPRARPGSRSTRPASPITTTAFKAGTSPPTGRCKMSMFRCARFPRSAHIATKIPRLAALAVLTAALAFAGLCRAQSQPSQSGSQNKSAHPNLGRPLAPDEIRRLDITVAPDGRGLPEGSGSVEQGAKVYAEKCQVCHGPQAKGGPLDPLTGGIGTLASAKPVKTPVSYWPSATTIFDYVRRAMPLNSPESLSNDEVYALTAYILSIDAVVPKDAVLD